MSFGRDILRDVEGYTPGEQPRIPGLIKLNTNENPYPPSPRVLAAVQGMSADAMKNYPDPVALEFRALCAERYGYDGPEWIIAGNGMDEILVMALRAFVDPGDTVLSVSPTYSLYETLVALHGAVFQAIDLDEAFQLPGAFYAASARACFIPRPNAPSGVCSSREDLARFCEAFDGIVVIDEAYADFAEDTCMDFPRRFDNVVVTRTFSKSFSLAGMRLGIGVARPEIIREFLKTKDSYNLNAATQAAGIAAMQDYAHMEKNVATVKKTRAMLRDALIGMGFSVPESEANFLLAQWGGTPDAGTIFRGLREHAVLVRYFDVPRLSDSLRISVGSDEEIERLLIALRELLNL